MQITNQTVQMSIFQALNIYGSKRIVSLPTPRSPPAFYGKEPQHISKQQRALETSAPGVISSWQNKQTSVSLGTFGNMRKP